MDTSEIKGLSSEEVSKRQAKDGYNTLPDKQKRNFIRIVLDIIKEPMIFLLIIIVIIYFFLGDRSEAVLLSFSVLSIIMVGLYQDVKTEKSLEALRDLSSPSTTVIRDGKRFVIPSQELVVGDIIVLSEGSRVPADARLINESGIEINESLLTGESDSVKKSLKSANEVFSGTMVVRGEAIAEVTKIGLQTEVGKIGVSLKNIKSERTSLQKEISRVIKILAILAVAASIILTLVYFVKDGDIINGLLAGLTLAIAIIPEEFPVVLVVFLALGAWRLAQKKVLTRRTYAIETLSSASVLCVDKTGTLTENKMTVMELVDADGEFIKGDFLKGKTLLDYAALASPKNPFDPMEAAILEADFRLSTKSLLYGSRKVIKTYPFGAGKLSVVNVWRDDKDTCVAMKGAPETVFDLCKLNDARRYKFEQKVYELASKGLRVIGVARGKYDGHIPESRQDFDFEFLGLVGLADPIKSGVKTAIKTCYEAGIRVIMMTGDHETTAINIAREAGLKNHNVMSGEEFEKLSESEKLDKIKDVNVFNRVTPLSKLAIVNSLKKAGEVVIMTGDGVNDAPALKAANIGIAMGKRGTDVARESAAIVLLDDRFASIVRGIRLGRQIYANLKKAMAYILSLHVPIITMSFVPVLFGWPIALMPAHIVLLELIIDPSCTLVFESLRGEKDIMKNPPRKPKESIFSKRLVVSSLLQGAIISAVIVLFYRWLMNLGWQDNEVGAMSFLMMMSSDLFLVLTKAGWANISKIFTKQSRSLLVVLLIAITLMVIIYSVPFMRSLFSFGVLRLFDVIFGLTLSLLSVLITLPIVKIINQNHKAARRVESR